MIAGIILFFSLIFCIQATIPLQEWNSLFDLYNNTSGETWYWKTPYSMEIGYPWNFTSIYENDPCLESFPWQGVTCSNESVISLILPKYGLKGQLQPSIVNLTSLEELDLSYNRLENTLPKKLGEILTLKYLYFENNLLTGHIPESIGEIQYLIALDVSHNNLTSPIPTFSSIQKNLTSLDLSSNLFSGEILNSFSNLENITYLNVSNNQLKGNINNIFSLVSLTILDLSKNQFSGNIQSSIGNLQQLKVFNLSRNHLLTEIPDEIGNLRNLQELHWSKIGIVSGTIPQTFIQLNNLTYLNLNKNFINGTLPSVFGYLTNLQILNLMVNRFHGTIPQSYMNLSRINYLSLGNNQLTGTIPHFLGNLTNLQQLFLNFNHFSKTIPQSLGQLNNVQWLFLDNNRLTGTIPTSLKYLSNLVSLNLAYNLLDGTIPEIFQNYQKMIAIYLNTNLFTGTLPISICFSQSLTLLTIFETKINGTIPSEIGNLTSIEYLILYNNRFSGTLPKEIANLTSLITLSLHHNDLSGNIQDLFSNLTKIQTLLLQNNKFSGFLPENLEILTNLIQLDLSNNYFSGPIDISNHYFPYLSFFDLSSNMFTGTLSSSLKTNFPVVSFFSVANNLLVGPLSDGIGMNSLEILYISNNSFTGTIPSALFSSQILRSFVASINCLSGNLPTNICDNPLIEQIALDGLHSSSSCTKAIFPLTHGSSYYLNSGLSGTIPQCLFNMSNLKILQLSGNKLTGTIPEKTNLNISSKFYSLILANNNLYGTLPTSILNNVDGKLDVSFNQLSGELSSINTIDNNLPSNDMNISLKTKVNRLSGFIPFSIRNLQSIDVLQGNMFECNFDRSLLPTHDALYSSYQCGSDFTNLSVYFWIGIICISIILFIYQKKCHQSIVGSIFHSCKIIFLQLSHVNNENKTLENVSLTNLLSFEQGLTSIFVLNTKILFWLLIVIGPVNILLSIWYSTQTYQYIWIISSSMLQGTIPAFILLTLHLVLVFIIIYHIRMNNISIRFTWFLSNKPSEFFFNIYHIIKQIKIISLVIGNILIVFLINVLYILALNQGFTPFVTNGISIGLSLFKVFWNQYIVLGKGREYIEKYFQIRFSPMTILCISIFNYILSPYFAEALISPNCFLYAITMPPQVTTQYYDFSCFSIVLYSDTGSYDSLFTCPFQIEIFNANLLMKTSFTPPFHYTYQCSASLLSSFSYVFIYRYLYVSFIGPSIQRYFRGKQLQSLRQGNYSAFFRTSKYLPFYMNLILPSDIFPTQEKSNLDKEETNHNHNKGSQSQIALDETSEETIKLKESMKFILEKIKSHIKASEGRLSETIAMRIVVDIFILLSFGVLFPLLGLFIFISLFLYVYFWKEYLHHLLTSLHHEINIQWNLQEQLKDIILVFNEEMERFQHILWLGVWFGVFISIFFWSSSIYDMLNHSMNVNARIEFILLNIFTPFFMLFFGIIFYTPMDTIGNSLIELTRISSRHLIRSLSRQSSFPSKEFIQQVQDPGLIIIQDNPIHELSQDSHC